MANVKGLVKGNPSKFQQNFSGLITNYAIDSGVKGRLIPFSFSPDGLSDSVNASYRQTTIPGASAPQITYSATGARTVSLSLNLPLDYLPPNSPYTNFEDYLNAFRALTYPRYSLSGGKVSSPHCQLLLPNIVLDGVCTQCGIEYKVDRVANDGSMSASISLSFMEVIDYIGQVDARWIANSKINVLGNTTLTNQSSGTGTYTPVSNNSASNEKCNITLLGNKNIRITSKYTSLKDIMAVGQFVDPGITMTRTDKYTVRSFYGCAASPLNSVTNIVLDGKAGKYRCNCNDRETTLYPSPFATNILVAPGSTLVYFIIYVPMYDGNKFDVDSKQIRYIHVKIEVS